MQYQGIELTAENYKEVLANKDTDIQEVVKHAILDNTNIGQYIDTAGNNSHVLLQIKISVQENIPARYILTNTDGVVIKLMREVIQSGLDLTPINNYINPMGGVTVSTNVMLYILSAYLSNANITGIDFTKIKDEVAVCELCKGLKLGYPLSLFTNLSSSCIGLIIRGMQLDYDMTPFASGLWSEEQILLIISSSVDYSELMQYLTNKFSVSQIEYIIDGIKCDLDISDIATLDKGKPVYSSYQMEELLLAMKQGVFSEDLLKPSLTPNAMAQLRMNLLRERAIKTKEENCVKEV